MLTLVDMPSFITMCVASYDPSNIAYILQRRLETIYFQVDPLSRRSLLFPETDLAFCSSITLCSVQSSWGKQTGPHMRSLEGGEGGIINLGNIKVSSTGLETVSLRVTPKHGTDARRR